MPAIRKARAEAYQTTVFCGLSDSVYCGKLITRSHVGEKEAVGARTPARRPKRRSRKPTESFEALLRRVGQTIHKDCNIRLGESNACDFSVSFKIGCCCCTKQIGRAHV